MKNGLNDHRGKPSAKHVERDDIAFNRYDPTAVGRILFNIAYKRRCPEPTPVASVQPDEIAPAISEFAGSSSETATCYWKSINTERIALTREQKRPHWLSQC